MLWCNISFADINLSCVMTYWNENNDYDKDQINIEYKELAPSHFSAIIEILLMKDIDSLKSLKTNSLFNLLSDIVHILQ